eukprot:8295055-Heterocapsa_arctica.AAC.1
MTVSNVQCDASTNELQYTVHHITESNTKHNINNNNIKRHDNHSGKRLSNAGGGEFGACPKP